MQFIYHFKKVFIGLLLAISIITIFLGYMLYPTYAATGINHQINFQGKLVKSDGTNVADGTYTVVFSIYDRDSGGTQFWTETDAVTTKDGIFRVSLGATTPIPSNINFNWDGTYLGMQVTKDQNGVSTGDSEMTPRIRFTGVPYAYNAEKVAGLTVQDTSGNASTSGTLQVANNKTISFGNAFTTNSTGALTINTFDSSGNTISFGKSGSLTVVDTNSSQDLTNKTYNGLTVTSSTIKPTAAGGLAIDANGSNTLSLGTNDGSAITFGKSGTTYTLNGLTGNQSDVLVLGSSGSLTTVGTTALTQQCLLSSGAATGNAVWGNCSAAANSYLIQLSGNGVTNGGYTALGNLTSDFLFGGIASTSATFHLYGSVNAGTNPVASISGKTSSAVLVVDNQSPVGDLFTASASGATRFAIHNNGNLDIFGGSPVASISAQSGAKNAIVLDSSGALQTVNKNTLTIGGASTGNINFFSATNYVTSAGSLALGGNFFWNAGTANLFLGVHGSQDGKITLYSSNASATDPTITTDSSGNLNLTAPSGNVVVGNSSGNISLSLQTQPDLLAANKTVTLSSAYSSNDYTFTRTFTGTTNNQGGAVFKVQDLSTATTPTTVNTDLILGNEAYSGTTAFTGNLLRLQRGGADKFSVDGSGNITGAATTVNLSGAALTVSSCSGCSAADSPNYWLQVNGNGVSNGGYTMLGNLTSDLLIGGSSTSSANFAFVNENTGTPTFITKGDMSINAGTNGIATLDVRPNTINGGTISIASISGNTSFAGLVVDNSGSGDLFTASASGATRFGITNSGEVYIGSISTAAFLPGGSAGALFLSASSSAQRMISFNPISTTPVSGSTEIAWSPNFQPTASVASLTGVQNILTLDNSASNVGSLVNVRSSISYGANFSGKVTNGYAWLVNPPIFGNANASVTNEYGLDVQNQGNAQITNSTGLFIEAQSGSKNSIAADIRGGASTSPVATISGNTTFAGLVVDNSGSGDIFTASSSGLSRFVITQNGNVGIGTTKPGAALLDVSTSQFAATYIPSSDLVDIGNVAGQEPTGVGINALQTTWNVKPATGNLIAGYKSTIINKNTATGGTAIGDRITATGVGAAINSATVGLYIDGLTSASLGTTKQNAIEIGANWDSSLFGEGDLRINANGNINLATSSATTKVGIGTNTPGFKIDVQDAQTATAAAQIWNTGANGQTCTTAACHTALTLRLGAAGTTTAAGAGDRFLQFQRGDGITVGNIQGSSNGIVLHSGNADYAEDFRKADPSEELPVGTLVCLTSSGGVTKCTSANAHALIGVVSDTAEIVGNDHQNDSAYVTVGLIGQLPVFVSTKNGVIHAGDPLTISDTSGVAQKATNAGQIIGTALADETSSDSTKVHIYFNPTYYNGVFADSSLPQGLTTDTVQTTTNDLLLLGALADNASQAASNSSTLSELFKDKVIAGLSVITPKVVTQDIITKEIHTTSESDLTITLDKDKKVLIGSSESAGISFDATGNASFAGTVVADTIKASHIAGLEVMQGDLSSLATSSAKQQDKLAQLEDRVLGLETHVATLDGTLALYEQGSSLSAQVVALTVPEATTSATVSLDALTNNQGVTILKNDLRVQGSGIFEGMLSVVDTLTAHNFVATGIADFFENTVFHKDVQFNGHLTASQDTAGTVVIKKDATKVDVTFTKVYDATPIVTASLQLVTNDQTDQQQAQQVFFTHNYKVVVTNETTKGFTILLNKKAATDVTISWIAIGTNQENKSSVSQATLDEFTKTIEGGSN